MNENNEETGHGNPNVKLTWTARPWNLLSNENLSPLWSKVWMALKTRATQTPGNPFSLISLEMQIMIAREDNAFCSPGSGGSLDEY